MPKSISQKYIELGGAAKNVTAPDPQAGAVVTASVTSTGTINLKISGVDHEITMAEAIALNAWLDRNAVPKPGPGGA